MPPHQITLDVSGRQYRTCKATLQTSPYFQNLLARWDECGDRQEDGSYFIDADPDVFQHVLQFMRRPSKFPLFWTEETGFDYALYNKLEAEADYFLLHDLRDWLREKRYVDAVKIVVDVMVFSESDLSDWRFRRQDADIEVQSFLDAYSGVKPPPILNHEFYTTITSTNINTSNNQPHKKMYIATFLSILLATLPLITAAPTPPTHAIFSIDATPNTNATANTYYLQPILPRSLPKCTNHHLPTATIYRQAVTQYCTRHFSPAILRSQEPLVFTYTLSDHAGRPIKWILKTTFDGGTASFGAPTVEITPPSHSSSVYNLSVVHI
ncbi:hypothetical protein BDW02DRAFT_634380 [Decorospora gaudefroyi]|uniref:BTB domain-containing protein n=1 Tax=Decorospora gaudefroyi TaxID=184978 RepID=A0A6A5JXF7_9PLEO|nr:hypothetical protein BDW02DRAFT_634380 [Decorospora gaudefroyi]